MLNFNNIDIACDDKAPGVKNYCSIYLNWHTHTHAYHISTKIPCNRITLFNDTFWINSVGCIWRLPHKIECNIGIEFLPFRVFIHNEQVSMWCTTMTIIRIFRFDIVLFRIQPDKDIASLLSNFRQFYVLSLFSLPFHRHRTESCYPALIYAKIIGIYTNKHTKYQIKWVHTQHFICTICHVSQWLDVMHVLLSSFPLEKSNKPKMDLSLVCPWGMNGWKRTVKIDYDDGWL